MYVPYIPIGYAVALAYLLLPKISAASRDWSAVPTLTLIPWSMAPALSVAWTLQHEVAFYIIFAIAFNMRKVGVVMSVWASAAITLYAFGYYDIFMNYVVGIQNIESVMGVLVAWAFIHEKSWPNILAFVMSLIGVAAFFYFGATVHVSFWIGLAIASVLPIVLRAEIRGVFKAPSWIVWLGDASYALYLLHNQIISLIPRILPQIGWQWALLVCLMTSLIAAAVYYLAFEKRAVKQTKCWLTARFVQPPLPVFTRGTT